MSGLSLPPERPGLQDLPPDYSGITAKKKVNLRDFTLYYNHKPWNSNNYVYQYSIYKYRCDVGTPLNYILTKSTYRLTGDWHRIMPLTRDELFLGPKMHWHFLLPNLNQK